MGCWNGKQAWRKERKKCRVLEFGGGRTGKREEA
jgi:hypothetical protein